MPAHAAEASGPTRNCCRAPATFHYRTGSCGAEDLVRLEAVVLEDGQRVALAPAATLRCPMAEAVARWVRNGSPARAVVTAGL